MSKKLEMMKKGFDTWRKLALTRVGINATSIAEDKREALDLVLEAAFEAGFSFGGATAAADLMGDLKEAINGKDDKIILTKGIPMPDHGHA